MHTYHKLILFLMTLSTGFASAATPGSYDFFQDPYVRICKATDHVKKAIPNTVNNVDKLLYEVRETAQAGSTQELAHLYAQLASVTQLRAQQVPDTEAQAAYLALVLEKLRISYYEQLDRLEAAVPYWEWAKCHTTRYTLSQLPHKWFSHDANKAHAERTYTTICALREIYSAEFGKIIRLLGQWHEENPDSAVWLAEVHTVISGILAVDSTKDLDSIETLIKKLAEHEQKVGSSIDAVQAPNWVHQHWIPLTVTAVAAGAAAYAYTQNKSAVDLFAQNGVQNLQENFMNNCYNPVKAFVNKIWYGQEELYPVTTSDAQAKGLSAQEPHSREYWERESQKCLDDASKHIQEGIDALGGLGAKGAQPLAQPADSIHQNGIKAGGFVTIVPPQQVNEFQSLAQATIETVAEPKLNALKTSLQAMGNAFKNITKGAAIKAQIIEHDKNRVMNETAFNRMLLGMIPAYLLATKTYEGIKGIFGWFTKRDRSALLSRLDQTEKVLIRTTHKRELSDAEYGRLLYLLTKAYDQVAKNVFSKERAPFLDDLTYIANNQSSPEQKKMTLDAMRRKYRSLEKAERVA